MERRNVVLACAGLCLAVGTGIYLTRPASPDTGVADPSRVRVVQGEEPAPATVALRQRSTETSGSGGPALAPVSMPSATAGIDPDDPVAAGLLPPDRDDSPHRMYARLRAEARDAAWAEQAERVLRSEYAGIPHADTPDNPLRSRCGSTICEVSGALPKRLQAGEVNAAMQAMQGQALGTALERRGLQQVSAAFSVDGKGRSTFVMYSTRKR